MNKIRIAMNQFEYMVLSMHAMTNLQIQEILNAHGNYGWILWHLDQYRIILFREKVSSPAPEVFYE